MSPYEFYKSFLSPLWFLSTFSISSFDSEYFYPTIFQLPINGRKKDAQNTSFNLKYSDRDVTYSNQCSSQKPSYRLRNIIDGSVRFKTMERANCVREMNMHELHRSTPTNEYGSFLNHISRISKYLRCGSLLYCHFNTFGFDCHLFHVVYSGVFVLHNGTKGGLSCFGFKLYYFEE